jgi:hypothetical protein
MKSVKYDSIFAWYLEWVKIALYGDKCYKSPRVMCLNLVKI